MSERKLDAPSNYELQDYLLELQTENIKLQYRLEELEDTSHISTFDIVCRILGGSGILGVAVYFWLFDVQEQLAVGDIETFKTLVKILGVSIGIYLGSSICINISRLTAKIRNT